MGTLDFTTAKLKHLYWKDRLRKFLDGKEEIPDAEMLSPKDCELGKWLYAEGMSKYGHLNEMKNLEAIHRELHALVKQILQAKNVDNKEGAEQAYRKLLETSQRIIAVLDEVQEKAA